MKEPPSSPSPSSPMPSSPSQRYGHAGASFAAAGGIAGITALVERFYAWMDELPDARVIRRMHPDDLTISADKLARFLCGWLGGPKRYQEVYGPISIPAAHVRFPIGGAERDAWMLCMAKAVAEQAYAEDFKVYLLEQLAVPAERVRQACAR